MPSIKILLAAPGTGKTTKVKEIIKTHQNTDKVLILSFTNATISDLLGDFKKAGLKIDESNCMTLHKYAARINHLTNTHILNNVEESRLKYYASALDISFGELCKMLGCMTFEDLIVSCTNFINTNSAGATRNIGDIDLLIIDEYQDFNEIERNFIEAVSQFTNEVFILGDDDQCIYGFKNADSEGIIKIFENSSVEKVAHENICYRCPDDIVKAGNSLICKNIDRIKKEWNLSGKTGELIQYQSLDEPSHNDYITEQIKKITSSDPEATIMILSPMSFGVGSLTERLNTENIPFINWWDNKTEIEIMNKIWSLRTIFGQKKLLNLIMLAHPLKKNTGSWKKFLVALKNVFLHGTPIEDLCRVAASLGIIPDGQCEFMINTPDFDAFFESNLELSAFKQYLENQNTREKDLEKLEQIVKTSIEFDPLKVNILSIFKSKGLQADYVFITDLVEGILPRDSKAVDNIEAERRLLYVGVSRARKKLFLLSRVLYDGHHAHKGNFDKFKYDHRAKKYAGQTSLFVNELLENMGS